MARTGLFSDVHGNLAALQAVLAKLEMERCDSLVCLGDTVGYGPCPVQCIELLREREIPCLMGNHDQYVTLLMDPSLERLREDIRHSVQWTQNQLNMETLKWLASLPMHLDMDGFAVVHGAFGPKPWIYCANERSLAHNFDYQHMPLGFCGHSHVPLIGYVREGLPPAVEYLRITSVPNAPKTMVNVGSAGQPRDRDSRACCVVYDDAARSITIHRVSYDIGKTRDLIIAAGLPERFAARLAIGR